ncbi:MAG: sugar ABC transporter permease [Herpetosiphon sp.]
MRTHNLHIPHPTSVRYLSRRSRHEALWGVLCVAPAVLGFLVWHLGPIIVSLVMSFMNWSIVGTPKWVGLANYQQIFTTDVLFRQSLRSTAYYAAGSVPLRILLAFGLAVLLNQRVRGLPVFRTIFYVPSIVPALASSVLWIWLFNPDFGFLNSILRPLGFPKFQWIYSSEGVVPSLVMMSLWDVGPMMIIFLAGLQGVPRHLYEAVEVDGGNAWHQLRHVMIPMITPTILFNLILSLISALQSFTQVFVMTHGGPNNASLFYVLYLYRKAFEQSAMGYASALAWILFSVIAVLSIVIFRSSSMWVYYEGEK